MEFYENLKYLRKGANLTQEQLAEKLNVSRQAVTKWESGQSMPDIQNLKQMADMFGVSMDNLVGDVKEKKESVMQKKIKDIGFYIFEILIVIIASVFSIINFINFIISDETIRLLLYIITAILSFVYFIKNIKYYLKTSDKTIINMKDTEQGKNERKKYITKKYLNEYIRSFIIFSIIISLDKIEFGVKDFLISILNNLFGFAILDFILAIEEYKKLEKKVSLYNLQLK